MKRIVLLLIATLLLGMATSCFGGSTDSTVPVPTDRPEPPSIHIGGVNEDEMDKELDTGISATFESIVKSTPTKEGYIFAGWYSDEELTDYIDPNYITETQYAKGKANAKWITDAPTTFQVRENEVSITDSGRKKQQLDVVEISRSTSYTLLDLQRAGFTYIDIEISLDLREENDGYQYVFLYRDSVLPDEEMDLMEFYDKYVFGEGTAEDPSLLHAFQYEHGSGEKDTDWDRITLRKSLRISDLKNDLYIRYGASGKDEDTWKNKNVVVTITPSK